MEQGRDWLIIANGEPLPKSQLKALAKNKLIVVLDGAFNQLKALLAPDVVLGDFDSIDRDLYVSLQNSQKPLLFHTPDQDATDLEKALQYVITFKPKAIQICQATGLRLDHTLYNLRLLKKFHQRCRDIEIISSTEKIIFLKDETVTVSAEKSQPLAVMSFTEATVTSVGLAYDMDDMRLVFAEQESACNALADKKATIHVRGDVLLIVSHQTALHRS